MTKEDLIKKAQQMRKYSYCPYSNFAVGAALLTDSGEVFTGCNIENASYPASCCAERTAIFKAISSDQTNFKAIAIVGGKKGETPTDFAYPCGVCRQVMSEFCDENFEIIVAISETNYKTFTLGELLPQSFGKNSLK
jgi:cytidine deaminase